MCLALQCQQVLSVLLHMLHFKATSMLLWPYSQYVSLIDCISDTRPQGRTVLHSPVKCLEHKYCEGYIMQSYKAVLGCAMR